MRQLGAADKLRVALIEQIATEKASAVPAICERLGLAPGDEVETKQSKAAYIERCLDGLDLGKLQEVAGKHLKSGPAFQLEEALLISQQVSGPVLSELTRRSILDLLDRHPDPWGQLGVLEVLSRVWPLTAMPATDRRRRNAKDATDDIWQHMINNPGDWTLGDLWDYLGVLRCSDRLFLKLLEKLVHPLVHDGNQQSDLVAQFNERLHPDGWTLQEAERVSGHPVFQAVRLGAGVSGRPKNLIFAAVGPKPELVLLDAVNNDVSITKNAEHCLIFDEAIAQSGLTWGALSSWWNARPETAETARNQRGLYNRLRCSLGSDQERKFFECYHRKFGKSLRDRLPVLIPQVYLHYDPYTKRERGQEGPLVRQRMDFLLLLSDRTRIVLEVDGVQHYSEGGRPNPDRYAEMVAEDRRLRLLGYEIYRFGTAELSSDRFETTVGSFFGSLFSKHGIAV